ncbi:MAG: transglycosylase domain-containing protein, partial [Desulfovibrionaceae bacterium]|nr:transglycosylase domain-containing protein [Desulfovibrionaceae bacterium]
MNMLRMVGVVFLAGFLLAALVFFGLYHWASKDLPGFKKITDYRPPLVTTVLTGDNQVLGHFFRERRFLVRLDEMSPYLPKAFLAAEDSGFYQHEGVDLTAIFRAALVNLRSGSIRQGGSTITQQIIKRLLLSSEKSYQRKLKEAILAYRLENYLTKEEILTIYLNQIYLGAGAYGVEAAARSYFGKHVADLNLAECALLAGLPQAPSHYNPYQHPRAAKARQKYVLEQMLGIGWISREEYEAALARDIELTSMDDPSWSVGPYYLEEVRRWLIARYGEDEVYEGGLTVYTPCDLFHQAAAEKALRNGLAASARRRGWIGPLGRLEPGQAQEFLRAEADLDRTYAKGDWVKVLVAAVDAAGAEVRFGSERGLIPVSSMDWCRTPDPKKAPEDVPKIKDARKVLAVGDLVWASVESAPGKAGGPWRLNLEREPEIEGAIVSLDPRTGDVLALSGGFSFERSQFNRATQARRQPGSAFKPIVYSAAIDEGFTAASLVLDAPIVFENQEQGKLWR